MTEATTYAPGRPIMTAAELASHCLGNRGRDYRFSDDGYSDMEHESRSGWRSVAGWGADGWDLGDWPYVSFLIRKKNDNYGLLQIVEGDRTEWTFVTEDDLRAAIDYLFLWYSAKEDWSPINYEQREALDAGLIEVGERFRGPYRA